ncbi:hypothetical protein Taro_007973, partial [Colocasia esculenta]|nr:hypothetical protein [Colocasia esculenta]
MCATCSAQGSGHWEGDAQNAQGFCSARGRSCGDFCWVLASSACPRCRESGRSRGNTGRSLHNAFFAKVVDAYRGYLSSWVPQVLCWAQDTSPFTVYERDKEGRRVLNAMVLHVVFLLPLRGGEAVVGFLGRFDVGAWFLACSRRKDLAWSRGNAEGLSFFAFFMK